MYVRKKEMKKKKTEENRQLRRETVSSQSEYERVRRIRAKMKTRETKFPRKDNTIIAYNMYEIKLKLNSSR
jgi:hypothetical protein